MAWHNELGKEGEEVAARYLMFHGYHIRHRNWKMGRHELDIVAEKRGVLIFVEVKTRISERYGDPAEAVDEEKQRNILSAANGYIHYFDLDMQVRYDVISVVGSAPPFALRHIENAFQSTAVHPQASYSLKKQKH